MAIISTVAAIVAAIAGLTSTAIGVASNFGRDYQQANYDLYKQEQQNIFDAEQNALERELEREKLAQEKYLKGQELAQEKYLATNKYQYSVNDMKRAGLNPALINGGISTGSSVGRVGGIGKSGTEGFSSAMQGASVDGNLLASALLGAGIIEAGTTKRLLHKMYSESESNSIQALYNARKELINSLDY